MSDHDNKAALPAYVIMEEPNDGWAGGSKDCLWVACYESLSGAKEAIERVVRDEWGVEFMDDIEDIYYRHVPSEGTWTLDLSETCARTVFTIKAVTVYLEVE